MKIARIVACGSVLAGFIACSGAEPNAAPESAGSEDAGPEKGAADSSPSSDGAASAPAPTAPATSAILYFDGDVDVVHGTITITVRTPSGERKEQVTLPSGTGPGEVYFHTCSVSAYNFVGAGGDFTGVVQAVNNMVLGPIPDLTIKMNVITDTGTTFSTSPTTGGFYGNVPNTGDTTCTANTLTWMFTQVTTTSFSFSGEADGTPPTGNCAAATENGNCTVGATNNGGTAGSCASGFGAGSCSYSCSNGVWTKVVDTCATAPCVAATENGNCNVSATNSGGASGSCAPGFGAELAALL